MSIRSRGSLKDDLLKRGQESHEKMDDSGRFGNFFKKDENLRLWKCAEGEHQIDIIPFEIGTNYPTHNHPNIKPGNIAYWLDLWVHYGVGPNEDSVVCPARNYGEACPICEHVNELRKAEEPDDDLILNTIPKRRAIYNIVCMDSDAEEDKGVQIWDAAHWNMEKHIAKRAKKPREGGFVAFAHPDEGKQVFFERVGTGRTNTEYSNHQFLDRDYKISDKTLDQAHQLDMIINVLSYDELHDAFWGKKGEEVEPEKPTRPARRRGTPEQKTEPEPETEQPPKRTARRTRAKPEESSSTSSSEPTTSQRSTPSETDNKCPGGGVFGVDTDKLTDACPKCEVWDDCGEENDRLEREQKEKAGGTTRRRRA